MSLAEWLTQFIKIEPPPAPQPEPVPPIPNDLDVALSITSTIGFVGNLLSTNQAKEWIENAHDVINLDELVYILNNIITGSIPIEDDGKQFTPEYTTEEANNDLYQFATKESTMK